MYKDLAACIIIRLHTKKRAVEYFYVCSAVIKGRVGNIFNLILKKSNILKTLKAFQCREGRAHSTFSRVQICTIIQCSISLVLVYSKGNHV
jgi:hypothetical protein